MRYCLALLLAFLLLACAHAQDPAALYAQAIKQMDAGDYAGALKLLVKAEKAAPEDPRVVYAKGLAASFVGEYAVAADAFKRLRKLEPDNWRALAKQIQALTSAGREREAQSEIAELKRWWKSGRNQELSQERSFVREQFPVGKYWIMAFEFFEPDPGRREHTWDFMVLDGPTARESRAMYYVMSDPAATSEIKGKDPYFFDVRSRQGGGTTLGIALRKPTYVEARNLMKRAINGEKIGPVIELP